MEPITRELGLTLKETEFFTRQGGEGIAVNPEVIKIAFTPELLKEGHNSEVIRLAENVNIVIRVKKRQEAMQQSFEQAKKEIQAKLALERSQEFAQKMGEQFIKEIQNGAKAFDLAKKEALSWKTKVNASRMNTEETERDAVRVAFEIPSSKLPALKGFILPNKDYLVVELKKVNAGDWDKLDEDTQRTYTRGFAEIQAQLEYGLYASEVLNNATVVYPSKKMSH